MGAAQSRWADSDDIPPQVVVLKHNRREYAIVPLQPAYFPSATCPAFQDIIAIRTSRLNRFYYNRDAASLPEVVPQPPDTRAISFVYDTWCAVRMPGLPIPVALGVVKDHKHGSVASARFHHFETPLGPKAVQLLGVFACSTSMGRIDKSFDVGMPSVVHATMMHFLVPAAIKMFAVQSGMVLPDGTLHPSRLHALMRDVDVGATVSNYPIMQFLRNFFGWVRTAGEVDTGPVLDSWRIPDQKAQTAKFTMRCPRHTAEAIVRFVASVVHVHTTPSGWWLQMTSAPIADDRFGEATMEQHRYVERKMKLQLISVADYVVLEATLKTGFPLLTLDDAALVMKMIRDELDEQHADGTFRPPMRETTVHTVLSGETMTAIRFYYRMTMDQFKELNPEVTNPNLIAAGQTFTVYERDAVQNAPYAPTDVKRLCVLVPPKEGIRKDRDAVVKADVVSCDSYFL